MTLVALVLALPSLQQRLAAHASVYAPLLRRLPAFAPDGPYPGLESVSPEALRRAAAIMPDSGRYFVIAPTSMWYGAYNGARLFLLPALEVLDLAKANWILAFHSVVRIPPSRHVIRTYSLGGGGVLMQLEAR